MYEDLMKSIEIERTGFFNEQTMLIDLQREHEAYIKKTPNRWFLSDTLKTVNIKVITSDQTKGTYVTGEENDIQLFNDTTK
jgi:hypothetical protein